MFKLIATNQAGQSLQITQNGDYSLADISGLTPSKATINYTDIAGSDNSVFNSARMEVRNIVLTIVPEGAIETNRIGLYDVFRIKQLITLRYTSESRDVTIAGYVESIEGSLFSQKQSLQISIICVEPFFKDATTIVEELSQILAMFEFPFAIELDGTMEEETWIPNVSVKGETTQGGTPSPSAPVSLTGIESPATIQTSLGDKQYPVEITFDGGALYGDDEIFDELVNGEDAKITRRFKMIEFDGTEGWKRELTANYKIRFVLPADDLKAPPDNASLANVMSTHYPTISGDQVYEENQGICVTTSPWISIFDEIYGNKPVSEALNDWKSYLSAQKAAGTPVKVVYELETPEVQSITPATASREYETSLGIPFSEIDQTYMKNIFNEGDVSCGMIIELQATGTVVKPVIYDATNRTKFLLNTTMNNGDLIRINTNKGQKSVMRERNSIITNMINSVDEESTWLQLNPGETVFAYDAESGVEQLMISVFHNNLYGGV